MSFNMKSYDGPVYLKDTYDQLKNDEKYNKYLAAGVTCFVVVGRVY
jgi:hypothetical protein